jgi:phenylacetate-CoA ligase
MSDIREQWRSLVRKHAPHLDAPANDRHWAPEVETCSRDRLRAIQSEKLAVAYRYLWQCSSFYRRKFEQAGLGPDSVRGIDDLPKIPLTHREEWLKDQEQNPPWGTFSPIRQEDWVKRGWMFFTTSGTTAKSPRVFRHTAFDREMWAHFGARGLYAMGIRPGDIAIICFNYGTSTGFWGMHYSLNYMGVPVISGGGANTERRAMYIDNYKPTVLMCMPSYALYLGRRMEEAGLKPRESSIRIIVASGEPGACVPATKRRAEDLWGAEIHDHFGCTEVAGPPVGYTCSHQAAQKTGPVGSHLFEDIYVHEALDPDSWQPVPEEKPGVLVVSNLFSEAQPILRYVMGDWISIATEPCGCGRTHARALGGLQGRHDKLIKIRGQMFYPATIEEAFRSLPEVGDEFRVQLDRIGDMDYISAAIEPSPDTAELADEDRTARVVETLKGTLGLRVDVNLVPYGSLPRTEGKADRLTDRRPKLHEG